MITSVFGKILISHWVYCSLFILHSLNTALERKLPAYSSTSWALFIVAGPKHFLSRYYTSDAAAKEGVVSSFPLSLWGRWNRRMKAENPHQFGVCLLACSHWFFSTHFTMYGIFYFPNTEKELLFNQVWVYHCCRLLPQEKSIYSF